ncbi:ISL3 family transposase [Streptomyces sp. NPDC057474]|uniref:ISL3 family transposase n=1 Tax=Streptomyces sp. NPDC057474 TaxID=3346144 RepID=UPI0036B98567
MEWRDMLFPQVDGLVIEDITLGDDRVLVVARAVATHAICPECGGTSGRVHSGYDRWLADAAVGGRPMVIQLRVRRFRCAVAACPRTTFAEQVAGLTFRYGRRSERLHAVLQVVALMLAGRAGARLTSVLEAVTSRSTLLRLIRSLPDPQPTTPRILGVDDFALRKGHVYGTVLIDIETRRPVDLLPDREAATLTRWLAEHPGVEIICRDRATAYAEGARAGAPNAVQVADRWHVWHNLAEAVDRCVTRHAAHLREPADPPTPQASAAAVAELEKIAKAGRPAGTAHRCADRTRERHRAVHALLDQGRAQREIARELGLARNTVRRFARATTWQELVAGKWQGRPSILDDYKPYLHQRWNEGCTSAAALFEEIRTVGYRGGLTVLRDYLRPLRSGATPREKVRPPSVRDVTGWITRHPDSLTPDETLKLKAILARCPDLDATAGHVHTFAEMMNARTGHQLPGWIEKVQADDLPEMHSFVNGVRSDQLAVTAGLTLPFSSGAVEGQVNRIKMLKRQMFGRANLDLLRKRVLLAA